MIFRIKHRLATFPVVDVPPCKETKSIIISNCSFSNLQRKLLAPWTFTEVDDHLLTPAFRWPIKCINQLKHRRYACKGELGIISILDNGTCLRLKRWSVVSEMNCTSFTSSNRTLASLINLLMGNPSSTISTS